MINKHRVFLVLCFAVLVHSGSARNRKEKEEKKLYHTKNLCDIQEAGINVFCYCNSQDLHNATESTCWIFNGEKPPDDVVWDYFVTQTNLRRLKFNIRPDGKLVFIPTQVLSLLPQLNMLEIQYATIQEVHPFAFANLSFLNDLSLSRNRIVVLKPHSFSKLPSLKTITLDENRVAELHRDVFVLPELKELNIAKNNLSVVHERAFSHLHHLEELELNENQLAVLTKETFVGLKSLKRLDLHLNHLTMLRDFTFSEMPHLDELELDENEIHFISHRAFHGLKKLTRLNLAANKLHSLVNDIFSPVPNILLLDLRYNQLTTLTADTVTPLMESLKNTSMSFHIDGNNFMCDCRLSWIYELRDQTRNEQVRSALEELTCILKEPLDHLTTETTVSLLELNKLAEDEYYDDETPTALPDNRKHLFQIPLEMLPCTEDLLASKDTTKEPYLSPDYDYGPEMVANISNDSETLSVTVVLLAVTALLMLGT